MIASWQALVIASPVSFLIGCGVGFVASNRWKIIRRNGD